MSWNSFLSFISSNASSVLVVLGILMGILLWKSAKASQDVKECDGSESEAIEKGADGGSDAVEPIADGRKLSGAGMAEDREADE